MRPRQPTTTRQCGDGNSSPYSGPENGNRDPWPSSQSGSIKFVVAGAVSPDSPLIAHHAKHGDGICGHRPRVPDVDRCIEQARRAGLDHP